MFFGAGTSHQTDYQSSALYEAKQAENGGDRQRAYQLSQLVAQDDPANIQAWLLCADTAPSTEEAINCLNHANSLQALDGSAKQKIHQIVRKLIEQDPQIIYLDEDDSLYHVRRGDKIDLSVPKDRSIPEPYPTRRPARLHRAYRWLWLSVLGLLFAGVGALIFAPLAAISAISLYFKSPTRPNRINTLVILLLSSAVWLFGLLIGIILVFHLV